MEKPISNIFGTHFDLSTEVFLMKSIGSLDLVDDLTSDEELLTEIGASNRLSMRHANGAQQGSFDTPFMKANLLHRWLTAYQDFVACRIYKPHVVRWVRHR